MRNQRYPMTEIGHAQPDQPAGRSRRDRTCKYGECEVKFYKGAKINDRSLHLHPGDPPRAAAELPLPPGADLRRRRTEPADPLRVLRLARRRPGGQPELLEEYTYLNLKLNNGFTDADFDTKNPNYKFR